ncbi:MAG TPA: SUF system Fe-S cluster assembly protein [Geminicoccaceae bacterium]|nr:SUF system Fe-S cluster assembly protein [Geminicoccus sp.]HMU48467.1 SUF system Fe-S cluster assembly protein [Geminicoccaceae bacterium]
MTEASNADVEQAAALLTTDEHADEKKRIAEVEALGEQIVEQLRTVYDPEIPVNIYELGLVYKIDVEDDNTVLIDMTLTSPHCPVAEILPPEVEQKVQQIEGVKRCEVRIVWDPPWTPSMMTEEAQLEMGLIY